MRKVPPFMERWEIKDMGHSSPCWIWTGHCCRKGYGRVRINHVDMGAHQAMYQKLVGPVPDGLQLDHLCRVKACGNPEHLEPVTNAENIRRAVPYRKPTKSRSHCPNGHEYTPDNLIVGKSKSQRCRICRNAQDRRKYTRRRAAKSGGGSRGEGVNGLVHIRGDK